MVVFLLMTVMAYTLTVASASIFAITDEELDIPLTYVNLLPESEDEMYENWMYVAGGNGDTLEISFDNDTFIIEAGEECTWPWMRVIRGYLMDAGKDIFLYYDINIENIGSGAVALCVNTSGEDGGAGSDTSKLQHDLKANGPNKGKVSIKSFFNDLGLIEDNKLELNSFRVQVIGAPNSKITLKQLELRCGTEAEADAMEPDKMTPKPTEKPEATPTKEPEIPTATPAISPTPTKAPTLTPSISPSETNVPDEDSESDFPTGMVIGIIVVAAAVAGGFIYYFLVVKKKK